MGSFDMACGVSGISLGGSQPVKLLFLAQDRSDNDIYPSAFGWSVISFPIDAEYYDYGYYDIDTEQPNYQLFVNFMKQNGIKIKQGNNKYHEQAFNPKSDSYDPHKLLDKMSDNRVRINHKCLESFDQETNDLRWVTKERVVKPFPIHKEIYEYMIRERKNWRGDVINAHTITKHEREQTKEHRELFEKLADTDNKELKEGLKALMHVQLGHQPDNPIHNAFRDYLVQNWNDVNWQGVGELHMLGWGMSTNRLVFKPAMYAGQELLHEEVAEFHSKCSEVAMSIEKKISEE